MASSSTTPSSISLRAFSSTSRTTGAESIASVLPFTCVIASSSARSPFSACRSGLMFDRCVTPTTRSLPPLPPVIEPALTAARRARCRRSARWMIALARSCSVSVWQMALASRRAGSIAATAASPAAVATFTTVGSAIIGVAVAKATVAVAAAVFVVALSSADVPPEDASPRCVRVRGHETVLRAGRERAADGFDSNDGSRHGADSLGYDVIKVVPGKSL